MSTNLLPVSTENASAAIEILGSNPLDKSVMDNKLTKKPDPTPKFDQTPSYLYLYEIGFGNDGKLQVKQTLYHEAGDPNDTPKLRAPIPHAEVPDRVQSIMNGKLPQNAKTSSFGSNFTNDDGHWDRVSYLAFVINHPNWKFCNGIGNNPPPAVFTEKRSGGKNHSFHDGAVATMGSGLNTRSVFYCVNHARDKNQNRLKDGNPEHFKYDLYALFSFDNGADDVILIFDPGGTNLGPPKEP
jgi:hypothetical protein